MQAWFLRKCMTIYNDIVRRVHLPREHEIRRVMAATGVDLSQYGPSSEDCLEPGNLEGAHENQEEEQPESDEEFADDPCS